MERFLDCHCLVSETENPVLRLVCLSSLYDCLFTTFTPLGVIVIDNFRLSFTTGVPGEFLSSDLMPLPRTGDEMHDFISSTFADLEVGENWRI